MPKTQLIGKTDMKGREGGDGEGEKRERRVSLVPACLLSLFPSPFALAFCVFNELSGRKSAEAGADAATSKRETTP